MTDIEAYFRRIGYGGGTAPSLEVLAALQQHHLAAIPFEAIDVLLGRGVDIAPAAVEAKLVAGGRGGYCFEQNGLFRRALEALGFRVDPLIARVNWMTPADAPPSPPTHMALRVQVKGEAWLADAGFGSVVPTAPLRLDSFKPQQTPHGTYRFVRDGDELQLAALIEGEWSRLYRLLDRPACEADYEMANWYTSTHPSSHFRHRLAVAKAVPEARYSLGGARLTVRHTHGMVEQRVLDAAGLEHELRERFGLDVQPEWRPVIEGAVREVAEA